MRKGMLVILIMLGLVLKQEALAYPNINVGPRCKKFFNGDLQLAEVAEKIRCRVRVSTHAGAAVELLHKQDALNPGTSDRLISKVISGDSSGSASTRITLKPGFLSTLRASSFEDSCGNGICEDVSCEAIGCPEPETELSCPIDCGELSILSAP